MNLDVHKELITEMGRENISFDTIAAAVNLQYPRVNCAPHQVKAYFEKYCGSAANIERKELELREKRGLK